MTRRYSSSMWLTTFAILFAGGARADAVLDWNEVALAEVEASGMPAEKYYEQVALLAQTFVKDGSQTIEDKIKATVGKVRENIVVRRFTRYEIGG